MLVLRPCTRDDADAVLAALETRDRHDFGVGDLARRELTRGEAIAAFALCQRRDRSRGYDAWTAAPG